MPTDYFFRDYVPVAARRARGERDLRRLLRAENRRPEPVLAEGRRIGRTFWGRAWCENLERYSDFASRMPRGRNYARNGSVLDLRIVPGAVRAYVAGHELYTVDVSIAALPTRRWRGLVAACGGKIGSLIGLLRGELPDDVLAVLTDGKRGLFPEPGEISMRCSCPDAAVMCKHVAATLYGVGVRLDREPELFFVLRQMNQADLIDGTATREALGAATRMGRRGTRKRIAPHEFEALFGIEMLPEADVPAEASRSRRRPSGRRDAKGRRARP